MVMIPDDVSFALNNLIAYGFEAYCVGGCVRDILLGCMPHDWDIATSALPNDVKTVFSDYPVFLTGEKHGTVLVKFHSQEVEITTFRIDGRYDNNRHPNSVRFTTRLEEDLTRRDFTINAMAMDINGEIIDLFGGKNDIRDRCIRCVGDANQRFSEDALRILRALRFSSTLGFYIDEKTSEAAGSQAYRLSTVSSERIQTELTKILCGKNVRMVLRKYADIIAKTIPDIAPMFGFNQHNPHHCYDVWEHTLAVTENTPNIPVLRWSALLHDIGKPHTFSLDEHGIGHFYGHQSKSYELAQSIMSRLRFDNESKNRILTLIKYHDSVIDVNKTAIKRKLNQLGEEALRQLLLLKRADNLGQAPHFHKRQQTITELEEILNAVLLEQECFSLHDLAINGNDLISIGIKGKDIGYVLRLLLEMVIDEKIVNDYDVLLKKARSLHVALMNK